MIDFNSGSYSPGHWVFVASMVIIGLILVGMVAGAILDEDDRGFWVGGSAFVVVFGLAPALVSYYPFSKDFHQYYSVSGTVASDPEKRIISSGDSISERVVIKFRESGDLFGVDDTRATTVKAGDKVDLRCKREFEWNSVPGWGCKWNTRQNAS